MRPVAAPGAAVSGLPAALTSLIGRDAETEAIVHLLAAGEAQLLTLTGPRGVGQARCANDRLRDL